jgi:TRAP transporter TAXI family solute receptor
MTEQTFIALLRRSKPTVLMAVLTSVVVALPTPARAGDEAFVSLGTGEMNGVYYPVGKAICEIVNQDRPSHGVRCSPETTPGSVYNLDAVRSGELDFAIVQSDAQFAAYNGQGTWLGRPFFGLRSVMSLYSELVTVMTRADTPIHNLADLAGRRLSVGSRDSGTRATWDTIQAELGWRGAEQVRPVELRTDTTVSALCSGMIDASLMIVGHPSTAVRAQRAACATNFVPVTGAVIEKLLRDHPYYLRGTIGASDGLAVEMPTIGVRATLVTSASVEARVVAVIVQELITHLREFRSLLPVLAGLTTGEMINDGLTAPLHPGAVLVYDEFEQHE